MLGLRDAYRPSKQSDFLKILARVIFCLCELSAAVRMRYSYKACTLLWLSELRRIPSAKNDRLLDFATELLCPSWDAAVTLATCYLSSSFPVIFGDNNSNF